MIVSREKLIANVNGVFNAIMVQGNCVGELLFYGAGAGKLPTASAVVADIVDSIKHRERSKKISWKKPLNDITASPEDKSFEYFVRSTSSKDEIEKVFGDVNYTDSVVDGENVFITKSLTSVELNEKVNKINTISAYRILD